MQNSHTFIQRTAFISILLLFLHAFSGCEPAKKKAGQTPSPSISLISINEKGVSFAWKDIDKPDIEITCLDAPLGSKKYTLTGNNTNVATLPYDNLLNNQHLYKVNLLTNGIKTDKNQFYFFIKQPEMQARGIDFSLKVDSIDATRAVISWDSIAGSRMYYVWLYDNGIGLRKDSTTKTSYRYAISAEGTEVFVSASPIGGGEQFSNRMIANDGHVIIINDQMEINNCDPGEIVACDSFVLTQKARNGCIKIDTELAACAQANAYLIKKVAIDKCPEEPDSLAAKTEYIQMGVGGEDPLRFIYTIRCLCTDVEYRITVLPFYSVGMPCKAQILNPRCPNCG